MDLSVQYMYRDIYQKENAWLEIGQIKGLACYYLMHAT